MAMVQPNMTGITDALRQGNAEALGQYFAGSVEIAVIDQEDRYNKTEAVKVMKQFFSKYSPSSFNQVHKGVSRGGNLHYSIGEMRAAEKTFRVYLLLEDGGDKYLIQQLRIDEE
jgi:hypothetical protein